MSLTAPYTNAMRIGQGFNTYTQEIRLENAVRVTKKDGKRKPTDEPLNSTQVSPPNTPPSVPVTEKALVPVNGAQAKQQLDMSSSPESNLVGSAIDVVSPPSNDLPFELPAGPAPPTSQSVTYSTRAIENVSDIMDALNISTSMSIKYGTIHGNGNASFVNETKVLDSELNYVVSVIVNNDALAETEDMEFLEIPEIPLDRFTGVYGDSFISGFTEGGIFNAVVSVKLNDKSKHKAVKQAVDVQLAVGPPTLEVGASEAVDKEHAEALKDTEITISVNWVGGGEVKKPNHPWTLKNVVVVANAFPSMVARSSSRTQAILTKYESLRSYQAWKWKRFAEEREKWEAEPRNKPGGENNKNGKNRFDEPVVILNYVPCGLYTADLFEALMIYKKLWKDIGDMLKHLSKYKPRPRKPAQKKPMTDKPSAPLQTNISPVLKRGISDSPASANAANASTESPCQEQAGDLSGMDRKFTFAIQEGTEGWDLTATNASRDPIMPEPVALNEARLLCREAMTLITEEASRLVDHPHLAYASFSPHTSKTRMKRPNYAYPEVLKERLPIPIHNDVLSDLSTDGAYLKTAPYAHDGALWFEHDMVGDTKMVDVSERFGVGARYEDFSTLALTEAREEGNPLRRLAVFRFRHGVWNPLGRAAGVKAAENAIGAIGLAFEREEGVELGGDGCSVYLGHVHHSDKEDSHNWKALDIGNVDITHMDISWVPGSGFIAGLVVYDEVEGREMERLSWRQWEGAKQPKGLKTVRNCPPDLGDGTVWRFKGLAGSWVDLMGPGKILARVTGVWGKVEEE